MPDAWRKTVLGKAEWIHRQMPKYVKDTRIKPNDPLSKGVDCSRYVYLAHHLAGVPGIERDTAAGMLLGRSGWTGYTLADKLLGAQPADIPYWKWRDRKTRKPVSDKLADHTGFICRDKDGDPSVLHASSGRGTIVMVPLQGVMVTDLIAVRVLTIGDKR